MNGALPWREAPAGDYAVVGDPVGRSLSPAIHAAAYRALGLELAYHAVTVPPGELAEAAAHLARLGFRGLNVTVPLKEEAFALFGSDRPQSEAANTVALEPGRGWNTDVPALVDELSGEVPGPAIVLGSGGAARAAVLALAELGWSVGYSSRRPGALDAWASRHGVALGASPPFSLVVNATSAGHSGACPEFDFGQASAGALAYDLSYGAAAEPFLARARERGLRQRDGIGMLVGQAARSLEIWLGVPAPVEAMREAACRS